MEIALCTCEGKVKRKDLEEIGNAHIFDKLCQDKPGRNFDMIGCSHPSLRSAGRILLDLNNLVFLKQKDAVEKVKIILKAYSELLKVNISFIEAEVDESLLVKTDDIDLVSMLSKHFEPLYVLTDNTSIAEIAVAIKGELKSISGKIGNFTVKMDGIDLRTGRKIDSIKVSQVIIPGIDDFREGIFSSEIHAIEAIYNRDGLVKVNPITYRREGCAVSFNSVHGCKLCRCPYGFISHRENVIVDVIGCVGCGLCTSLCPTDALSSEIFPRDIVLRMIDIMAEYRKEKTLLFACRNAIAEAYGEGKVESFFPVIVPCINSLSEVEIIYPLLKGFNGVYILPCSCPHGDFEGVKRGIEIAGAFGINNIVIKEDFDSGWIKRLNNLKPVSSDFKLHSSGKRDQLVEMLSWMCENLTPIQEKLSFNDFGMAEVSDSCTLCNTCSNVCITRAVRKENGKLEFRHGLCINCSLCMIFCPEKAMKIETGLYLEGISNDRILKKEKMIKCPRCKKEHISESEYRKISALTGHRIFTLYCDDCKPIIVFEGLYKEITGEEDEQNR